jgi:hypothetical protein
MMAERAWVDVFLVHPAQSPNAKAVTSGPS